MSLDDHVSGERSGLRLQKLDEEFGKAISSGSLRGQEGTRALFCPNLLRGFTKSIWVKRKR